MEKPLLRLGIGLHARFSWRVKAPGTPRSFYYDNVISRVACRRVAYKLLSAGSPDPMPLLMGLH